jgi:hypothetical protein
MDAKRRQQKRKRQASEPRPEGELGGRPTTGGMAPGGAQTGLSQGSGYPSVTGAGGATTGGVLPVGAGGGSGTSAGGLAAGVGGIGGTRLKPHGAGAAAGSYGSGGVWSTVSENPQSENETGEAGTRTGSGGVEPATHISQP